MRRRARRTRCSCWTKSTDVDGLPRRPVGGPASRCSTRAEPHVPGSLPRRRIRPVERDVHLHGQRAAHGAQALRDRMEVLQLPGYTELEKTEIAKRFLVPKSLRGHGPAAGQRHVHRRRAADDHPALHARAGVRNLEREIQSICARSRAAVVARARPTSRRSRREGDPVPRRAEVPADHGGGTNEIGLATGLAWTEWAARSSPPRRRSCRAAGASRSPASSAT